MSMVLSEKEREVLRWKFAVLMARKWNVRKHCLKLGISRDTGHRWIKKLRLKKSITNK